MPMRLMVTTPSPAPVDPVRKALWRSIKSWRNEIIHCGTVPGPRESRILLDEVNRLEEDLDSDSVSCGMKEGRIQGDRN